MFQPVSMSTVPPSMRRLVGRAAWWWEAPSGYWRHAELGEPVTVHEDDLVFLTEPLPTPVP